MAIKKQIEQWEFSTCVRFIPRTHHEQKAFVFFTRGERCVLQNNSQLDRLAAVYNLEFRHGLLLHV